MLTIRDLLDGTIYTLTETGYSLKPILDAMVAWGQNTDRKTAEKTLLSSKPFGVMIFQNILIWQ